jgi:hypothetical protein
MGKASRAKRAGGGPAAATVPTRSASGSAKSASSSTRPAKRGPGVPSTGLDAMFTGWGSGLAAIAATCWLLGHIPALAPVAIPAWIVTALALGFLQPWLGLLLTIAIVPFLGGATNPIYGEVLRVMPIYGAAARVLLDRFVLRPSLARGGRQGPPWWVVAAAVVAAGLYAYTAQTGSLANGGDPAFLDSGLHWLAGGPIAMMAACIAASHLVAGRDRILTNVVLGTTVVGCVLALAAWIGVPGLDLITFPASIAGRLAALGYPTPTAMGIAMVLPFAVAAALRYSRWLAAGVIGLALLVLILAASRGPLIAIGLGTVIAVLASGRVGRRIWIAGAGVGAVALVGLVALRYGTNIDTIVQSISGQSYGDVDRALSWGAGVAIAIANPLVGGGWRSLERFGDFAQRQVAYSHNILLHAFSEGGLPLGIATSTVILYSAWNVWRRRHAMAPYLIAAVVTVLVCGFWDMPQVRSYASVMGGIVLGMAAGPLIGRGDRRVEGAIGG